MLSKNIILRFLFRNWRSGEVILIMMSLFLSAILLSSSLTMYRIFSTTIQTKTRQLLGGDVVWRSPKPFSEKLKNKLKENNMMMAKSVSFVSVVSSKGQMQLVNLNAVGNQYPLLGSIKVKNKKYSMKTHGPQEGSIWLSPELSTLLSIKFGGIVKVGGLLLRFNHYLVQDPVQRGGLYSFLPAAMVNIHDIDKTRLLTQGSRADYRLYLLTNMKKYHSLFPKKISDIRVLTAKKSQIIYSGIFKKGKSFYELVISFSFLISFVAIAYAFYTFCLNNKKILVLLYRLGSSTIEMISVLQFQILMAALFSVFLGVIIGIVLSNFIWLILPERFWIAISSYQYFIIFLKSFVFLSACLIILSLCIILPFVLSIRRNALNIVQVAPFVVIAFLYFLINYLVIQNLSLSFFMLLSIILLIGVFYIAWRLFLRCMSLFSNNKVTHYRYAIRYIIRNPSRLFFQSLALFFSVIVIISLFLVRLSFINSLSSKISAQAPNYFVYNISPEKIPLLKKVLLSKKVKQNRFYPIVRARWTKVNGQAILDVIPTNMKNHNALSRELNLTNLNKLPKHDQLALGAWCPLKSKHVCISVEQGLFKRFHLKLGDKLGFRIGDVQFQGVITSVRKVDWLSLRPGFYFIFTGLKIHDYPISYLTQLYFSKNQQKIPLEITGQFPNVSLLNLTQLLNTATDIIDNLSWLMFYITLFCIVQAILILFYMQRAAAHFREKQFSLFLTLGASLRFILLVRRSEKILLINLLVLFSLFFGIMVAYFICHYVLSIALSLTMLGAVLLFVMVYLIYYFLFYLADFGRNL